MTDYYQVLEVSPNATAADIKKAYRQMVKRYHPDSAYSKGDNDEMIKLINQAYEILSNIERRSAYNKNYSSTQDYKDQHKSTTQENYNSSKANQQQKKTEAAKPSSSRKMSNHKKNILFTIVGCAIAIILFAVGSLAKTYMQEKEIKAKQERFYAELGQTVDWGSLTAKSAGIEEVRLTSKWTNNTMYYIIKVTPSIGFEKRISSISNPEFTVILQDSSGFDMHKFPLPISNFVRNTNDDGSTAYYEANSKQDMSAELYISLSKFSFTWNF